MFKYWVQGLHEISTQWDTVKLEFEPTLEGSVMQMPDLAIEPPNRAMLPVCTEAARRLLCREFSVLLVPRRHRRGQIK